MISEKLEKLKYYFNLPEITHTDFSIDDTSRYYHINRRTYSLFHSKKYTHMGISEDDGKLRKTDFERASQKLVELIRKKERKKERTEHILELACGRGGTLNILSSTFPKKKFFGIDYSRTQLKYCPAKDNVRYSQGDYHSLEFDDNSFDVVFVIEALCHSTDKKTVFKEVHRILRPGGVFVIVDGYSVKEKEDMSKDEKLAFTLVSKGMAVQDFESYTKVTSYAEDFTLLQEECLSKNILPTTQRFERMADTFFQLGFFAKTIIRFLPTYFTMNIISGYLISDLIREDIASYWITYFRK